MSLTGTSEGEGVNATSDISANLITRPHGLVLDSQLNLYVADFGNYRIQKFFCY